ncbi:hypothetical protein H8S23_02845 [Anaerofilum sp. BX8]|uniref:Uncharacterized protein n=1 Tax=Anaerofilum hominis TaxID=2763016 RepID=A0A923I7X5_9FIRM|nr:hypothetical protein [Anaerofilum hominis]MBC5580436.1 hypothetical protein [Anaerofilum hominis]
MAEEAACTLPPAIFYCSARTAALSLAVAITAIVIVPAISGVVFSLIDTGLFRLVLGGAAFPANELS